VKNLRDFMKNLKVKRFESKVEVSSPWFYTLNVFRIDLPDYNDDAMTMCDDEDQMRVATDCKGLWRGSNSQDHGGSRIELIK
jgi:hypothetical protein